MGYLIATSSTRTVSIAHHRLDLVDGGIKTLQPDLLALALLDQHRVRIHPETRSGLPFRGCVRDRPVIVGVRENGEIGGLGEGGEESVRGYDLFDYLSDFRLDLTLGFRGDWCRRPARIRIISTVSSRIESARTDHPQSVLRGALV